MDVRYLESPAAFRHWLASNHDRATELWVGFYKKATGRGGLTYPEAVDQALCFGWIDGIRKGIDADSYANRFTPRKRGSNWSAINVRRVAELAEQGLMHPAGLAAFEGRDRSKQEQYSFERNARGLDVDLEADFRANASAWDFWEAQPPGYRRMAAHWVMSAKQETTRRRRLATLIEDSAAGRRLAMLARTTKK